MDKKINVVNVAINLNQSWLHVKVYVYDKNKYNIECNDNKIQYK